jgi:hypothetical protein
MAPYTIVTFSIEAGLMCMQIDDDGYLLDTDDLAQAGAVLLRLLAEGRTITPEMIPALLRR